MDSGDVAQPEEGPAPEAPWVLVIDDDQAICDAFREVLQDAGYSVETATDGQLALGVLPDREPPVIVLVDLVMPIMDGWGFIAALRALPGLADVPVVSMTAHGPSVLARAPVSQDYFTKPVALQRLLQVVERARSRRLARLESGTRVRPGSTAVPALVKAPRRSG